MAPQAAVRCSSLPRWLPDSEIPAFQVCVRVSVTKEKSTTVGLNQPIQAAMVGVDPKNTLTADPLTITWRGAM